MLDYRPIVLVAGSGRSSFERLAPVLDRRKLEVIQVTSAEDAARLAYSERVDLVILDAEPATMSLEEIVGTIRAGRSASNKTSLLVLAPPGRADAALALVGRGVNRVMLAADPVELIAQQVAALLHVAPRFLSFADVGRARLEAILDRALGITGH